MKHSKDNDIKVYSNAGRLYIKPEEIINSSKGKELINIARNSSIYKEIINNKKAS